MSKVNLRLRTKNGQEVEFDLTNARRGGRVLEYLEVKKIHIELAGVVGQIARRAPGSVDVKSVPVQGSCEIDHTIAILEQ